RRETPASGGARRDRFLYAGAPGSRIRTRCQAAGLRDADGPGRYDGVSVYGTDPGLRAVPRSQVRPVHASGLFFATGDFCHRRGGRVAVVELDGRGGLAAALPQGPGSRGGAESLSVVRGPDPGQAALERATGPETRITQCDRPGGAR